MAFHIQATTQVMKRLGNQEVHMYVTDSSLRGGIIQNPFHLFAFLYFLEFLSEKIHVFVLKIFRPGGPGR